MQIVSRLFRCCAPRGFTLVEILVVVALISILAAAVMVSISEVRDGARVAQAREQLTAIEGALKLHMAERGQMPAVPASFLGLRGTATHPLRPRWIDLVDDVEAVTGTRLPELDPWGNFFGFMNNYQNPNVYGVNSAALLPSIVCSLGPDQLLQTWNNWSETATQREAQGDDLCIFFSESDDGPWI